ncbi:TIGR03621 family F420-dependent LLM class oxidoreductase [Nocardia sp. NPDC006044]|uniref:TIGR03621 family F420-dependent LLM class oxidoreductase n=1 Tax=Nocardia sp. NPDC006044 TaxID=3364306 RepID=UPI0036963EE7
MNLPFRFGVVLFLSKSGAEWTEKCRTAEALGFDVIAVPDHLGVAAPIPGLMMAAAVTARVRLGTFVLNTSFYNPVLLARDVAFLDQLSGGRVELGLGAGYVRSEFDEAGIPFAPVGERMNHLVDTVATLKRLFGERGYRPRVAQPGGPPLMIPGWGPRGLGIAAAHADIVSLTGIHSLSDSGENGIPRMFLANSTETATKADQLRQLLAGRSKPAEVNMLVHRVAEPSARTALDAELRDLNGRLAVDGTERLEDVPELLIGTPDEMADAVRERRERFGINYITVYEADMWKFAPVIELLR